MKLSTEIAQKVLPTLAHNATMVVYGKQSGQDTTIGNETLIFGNLMIKAFHLGSWRPANPQLVTEFAKLLMEMVMKGQLDAKVQHAYALGEFNKAMQEQLHSKSGSRTGKILFDVEREAEE